jgi:uncharacterized protein YprB with RNaseH-like and TPR domain
MTASNAASKDDAMKQLPRAPSEHCEHGHTREEHPSCFKGGKPWWADKKIGYLDIEASNLKADFGMILSWYIKERGKEKYYHGLIDTPKPNRNHDHLDKSQVEGVIEAIKKFDIITTYYGLQFDVPFIKSRAFHHGIEFPSYGSIVHWDLYFLARHNFILTSRRQNAIAELMFGKSEKTRLRGDLWNHAVRGNRGALNYISDHNKRDVRELERLHTALMPYIKPTRRSL